MAETRAASRDGVSDSTSVTPSVRDGVSDEIEDEKQNPFESKSHDPDAWVTVKVRASTRDRFDRWYQSQYPGWKTKLLPEKSPFSDQVFGRGIDWIEAEFPPVEMSLAERIAKARASQ